MAKLNKKWLTLLSSTLLLSQLATVPVLAQEETESEEPATEESVSEETTTEESASEETEEATSEDPEAEGETEEGQRDLFAIGENNPFTEEELASRISPNEEFTEDQLYTYDEIATMTNELIEFMRTESTDGNPITQESTLEFLGDREATETSATGSSEFYSYVSQEPLKILELTIQFYDNGNGLELANLTVEHQIPSNFEPLEITEEEIQELSTQDGFDTVLVDRLGLPSEQMFYLVNGQVLTTYTWTDSSVYAVDAEVEPGTLRQLTIDLDADNRFADYEMFYVEDEDAETTEEESTDEEATESTQEETTEESADDTEATEETTEEESTEEAAE